VFDFTRVRDLSKKIVVEDDPAKIDRFLARLHATISKEVRNSRMESRRNRTIAKRQPTPRHP
jgi:hypothetical protein